MVSLAPLAKNRKKSIECDLKYVQFNLRHQNTFFLIYPKHITNKQVLSGLEHIPYRVMETFFIHQVESKKSSQECRLFSIN